MYFFLSSTISHIKTLAIFELGQTNARSHFFSLPGRVRSESLSSSDFGNKLSLQMLTSECNDRLSQPAVKEKEYGTVLD